MDRVWQWLGRHSAPLAGMTSLMAIIGVAIAIVTAATQHDTSVRVTRIESAVAPELPSCRGEHIAAAGCHALLNRLIRYATPGQLQQLRREMAITALRGPRGEPGVNGERGVPGLAGARGARGLPGRDGTVGARGDSGKQGAAGPTGPQGPQGAPGTTGPRGAVGLTGATGILPP